MHLHCIEGWSSQDSDPIRIHPLNGPQDMSLSQVYVLYPLLVIGISLAIILIILVICVLRRFARKEI